MDPLKQLQILKKNVVDLVNEEELLDKLKRKNSFGSSSASILQDQTFILDTPWSCSN